MLVFEEELLQVSSLITMLLIREWSIQDAAVIVDIQN
jgi:hypothetical protein